MWCPKANCVIECYILLSLICIQLNTETVWYNFSNINNDTLSASYIIITYKRPSEECNIILSLCKQIIKYLKNRKCYL
jgi:hypothetical protein